MYVNADLIAAGLSPFVPGLADLRAGQVMLEEIALHVRRLESFAFETTLSGRIYARMIPGWRERGFRVKLIYLRLKDIQIGLERVRVRVRQGGHNVPEEVIEGAMKGTGGISIPFTRQSSIHGCWTITPATNRSCWIREAIDEKRENRGS